MEEEKNLSQISTPPPEQQELRLQQEIETNSIAATTNQKEHQTPEINIHPVSVTSGMIFKGIRRRIKERQLRRAEKKLQKLESNDQVIKSAPVEADTLRGFGSDAPQHRPAKAVQKIAFSQRGAQVAKKRKQERELVRLRAVYGRKPPVDTKSRIKHTRPSTAAAVRWNEGISKLNRIDQVKVVSFNPREEESSIEKAVRLSAQRKHSRANRKINEVNHKLEEASRGDTVSGRIRKKRIEKNRQRITRLQQQLTD